MKRIEQYLRDRVSLMALLYLSLIVTAVIVKQS